MGKLTKIKHYLSIQTMVCAISDDCKTDEDAVALVEAGVVKVNGKVIKDRYYALTEGKFTLQIGQGKVQDFATRIGRGYDDDLLRFTNKPRNLKRLREGQVLIKEFTDKDGDLCGYRFTLEPPNFDGKVLIACNYGHLKQRSSNFGISASLPPSSGITECGARV